MEQVGRGGKQATPRRRDDMHHSDDEDDYVFTGDGHGEGRSVDDEGLYEDVNRKEEGDGDEDGGRSEEEAEEEEDEEENGQEEEDESVDQSKDEPEERGSPEGMGRQGKGGKVELSGYVDELLGEALNLSLEKPEEAVQRLRARLGLSNERSLVQSGVSEEDSEVSRKLGRCSRAWCDSPRT